jgi:hypothetical protein
MVWGGMQSASVDLHGTRRLDAGSKVFFGWTGRDNPIKLRPILQRRAGCTDPMHVGGRSAAV